VARWPLLLIAVAPFVLAYIIARDHQLTWARGELTAVLAIAAFGLLLYVGVIDRPGDPAGQIELEWGWYVALAGGALMLTGAALRASESERARKPPGRCREQSDLATPPVKLSAHSGVLRDVPYKPSRQ